MKKGEKKQETEEVSEKGSEIKARMKVQELLQKNMRTPLGMFHGKELNERCFVNDIFKELDIKLK